MIVAVAILNSDRGVPLAVMILLGFVVGMEYVVKRTTFGRHVFAVGGNAEAARRAGIRVNRVRVAVFMISGSMAAIGGVMAASRLFAVNQNSGGNELLLLAIAGPVIAGTSLFGGRGSVWTALLGALVIGSISNGMDLLSLSSAVKLMVTGGVLLLAVLVDAIARQQRQTPAGSEASGQRGGADGLPRGPPRESRRRRMRAGRSTSAAKRREAPIAPPRSPSVATRTAGGRSSTKRCLPISFVSGSMKRSPKRTPSPPPMMIASGSIRLTAEAIPVPSASIARWIRSSARWSLCVDRALPDAAGQARFLVLLHQLEEVGLDPLFVLAACLGFHRRAARVGLHAALAPAGALGAAALDDHVADLAGGAAAEPGLAVEDEAAADPGSPEDADQALELAPGAEVELGLGRDLDVVADPHLGPQRFFSVSPSGKLPSQPGRFLAPETTPVFSSASPGEPTPTPSSASRLDAGCRGRFAQRLGHRSATSAGPPSVGVGCRDFAEDLAVGVDDRGLDLGPAEVDAAAQSPCPRPVADGEPYLGGLWLNLRAWRRRRGMAALVGEAALV